jgi:hypothetical protein
MRRKRSSGPRLSEDLNRKTWQAAWFSFFLFTETTWKWVDFLRFPIMKAEEKTAGPAKLCTSSELSSSREDVVFSLSHYETGSGGPHAWYRQDKANARGLEG